MSNIRYKTEEQWQRKKKHWNKKIKTRTTNTNIYKSFLTVLTMFNEDQRSYCPSDLMAKMFESSLSVMTPSFIPTM